MNRQERRALAAQNRQPAERTCPCCAPRDALAAVMPEARNKTTTPHHPR